MLETLKRTDTVPAVTRFEGRSDLVTKPPADKRHLLVY